MQRLYDVTETTLSVCRGYLMPLRLTSECMQRLYDATETNLRVYSEVLSCH